jgi:hypothetical protein
MAEEGKGVALAILGIVAVIAVVGLVLLFKGATGKFVQPGIAKVYGGDQPFAVGLDPTNPDVYGDYDYENWDNRRNQFIAAGGAWDQVYGDGSYVASSEDGRTGVVAPSLYGTTQQPTLKRSEQNIPTRLSSKPCDVCPARATCELDPTRAQALLQAGATPTGVAGCYYEHTLGSPSQG